MVRPGVVGATTGTGVGLPLLLFVIFLSSQTHAAVTLLKVAPISTSSTSRYLTTTTSNILWKRRDSKEKFNKPLQPLDRHPSSSSSSSVNIIRHNEGSRWFLPDNFRVLEPLGWKDSLEGGQGQIDERRRKTNLEDISETFPVGNVELGDLSNLSEPDFKIRSTTLLTTSRTVQTEATGSVRESQVQEKQGGGSFGIGVTERVRNSGVVKVQVKNVSGEITTSVDVLVGDSGVEWTTATATTVAGPMSSLSYPGEAQGAGRVRIQPGQKQRRPEEEVDEAKVTSEGKDAGSSSSTIASTTTQSATTELPQPTRDTSMEARKSICIFANRCL